MITLTPWQRFIFDFAGRLLAFLAGFGLLIIFGVI